MNQIGNFLNKYIAKFVGQSRRKNPLLESKIQVLIPPLCSEIESLIVFLQESGFNPIIIGTLAMVKHLEITDKEIHERVFRPAPTLELFIEQVPSEIPENWKKANNADDFYWVSPSGGYVEFKTPVNLRHLFNPIESFDCDQESIAIGCPVASVRSIFRIKLDSNFSDDMAEALSLASKIGVPQNIQSELSTEAQKKNFEMLQLWVKLRSNKKM